MTLDITTRATKGTPLTPAEQDANFGNVASGGGFATRAAFLAATVPADVSRSGFLQSGVFCGVIRAAGGYLAQSNGQTWVADGDLSPQHMGAVGDGVADDSAAVVAWAASDLPLRAAEGKTYRISSMVTFPDGTICTGNLTLLWAGASSVKALDIGALCSFGTLSLSCIAGIGNVFCTAGLGLYADRISGFSDTQINGSAFLTVRANSLRVKEIETDGYTRPVALLNDGTATPDVGGMIDKIVAKKHIRVFTATTCDGWKIGKIVATERSSLASKSPGHNGMLINGCRNWTVDVVDVDGAGEHTVRISVDGADRVCSDWKIGELYSTGPDGCHFKATGSATTRQGNGFVGMLSALGRHTTSPARNSEVIRITKADGIRFGTVVGVPEDGAVSIGANLLAINNATDIFIGSVDVSGVSSEVIYFNETQDTYAGPVSNVKIGHLVVDGATAFMRVNMPTQQLGDVEVLSGHVQGVTDFLALTSEGGGYSGTIRIALTYNASVVFNSSIAPADPTRYLVDLTGLNGRVVGPVATGLPSGRLQIRGVPADLNSVLEENAGGLYLSTTVTEADGARGAHIGFSRLAGGRRGAAIGVFQDGAAGRQMGLSFAYGAGVVGTDALFERWRMRFAGNFEGLVHGAGITLTSPDGLTTRTITIDNAGVLTVA